MPTSTEHPNVGLINQALDYFAVGDLPGFMTMFSDVPIYAVPGQNQISGVYRGKEEINNFFLKLVEITGGTFRVTPIDIIADDRHAFMMWRATASRDTRTLEATGAMAFKIDSAGKFCESWFLYEDQDAYNAFYS